MKTDKEFALDILGWLETYLLRISILEHLLKESGMKDWRARAEKMSSNTGACVLAHQEFEVWRQAILNSPDISKAAEDILASLKRRETESME